MAQRKTRSGNRSRAAISSPKIEEFDFQPGRLLAGKYRIEALLGSGWEGEAYRVTEVRTGVERAAKIFYPHRNEKDRALLLHAQKLDKLRSVPVLIQYHHSDVFRYRSQAITFLISELVEGESLEDYVSARRGKRLPAFEALHLLHALAKGIEEIHDLREYHGDLHDRNILVQRSGIGFDVKLLDFYYWGAPTRGRIQDDVVQLARILYDMVGGRKHYSGQWPEIKKICCGLRQDLIKARFPTAGHLRRHLESFEWDSA